MNLAGTGIKAINFCEPDDFITSSSIESDLSDVYERLKLPVGRIEMQTGVISRGVYLEKKPSDIASIAASNLFSQDGIDPASIDLLIYTGVCRDFLEPSTASMIHDNLKLRPDCQSFDLSNACLGFVNGMSLAASLIKGGSIKNVLVVTGENSKPLIDFTLRAMKDEKQTRKSIKKYFANFSIGSAGVAAVISGSDLLGEFTTYSSLSDSSANKLCQGSGNLEELVMETDSEELMQKGISLAKTNWLSFSKETDMKQNDFQHFICHQVGIHHRDFMYKSLELDLAKDHTTFDRYGNTGSAALPLTLAKAFMGNKFKKHDEIAMLGIGSGLHTIMMGVKWC